MDEAQLVDLGERFPSSPHRRGVARCASSQGRPVAVRTLRIEGGLVPYLRKGALRQMAAALEVLNVEVTQDEPDPDVYGRALARFDEARALFDVIGLSESGGERDIELDVGPWHALLAKALKTQYSIEVSRLEDAAADGVQLDQRHVPALGKLVAELRERPDPHAPANRHSFLRFPRRRRG